MPWIHRKPERVLEIIPYGHVGLISSRRASGYSLGEGLAAGAGLIANFRLDEGFGLFLDGRAFCHKSNTLGKDYGFAFAADINLGVTYNFGGDSWKKASDYVPGEEDNTHYNKDYRTFALSTNIVNLAILGTINLGAQYEISRHWTLEGKLNYNPWTFRRGTDNQYQLGQQSFALGARWWPWYSFAGFWMSADAQFKNYRTGGIAFFQKAEDGMAYGASLGLGYSFIINKHFNIDFGISGWGGYKQFVRYEDAKFKKAVGYGKGVFISPDEVSIAATFLF